MTNPRVSVLMPVYNGERYLREAVESILSQTFDDFEFIIVDDGSTDDTKAILDSYCDPRIVRLNDETNVGLVASLNRGLQTARGKYIARMDADDVSLPERLRRQTGFLERHPDVVLLGSDCWEIDEVGTLCSRVRMPTDKLTITWHALFQNPFVHSTVMFRKAEIYESGNYSVNADARHVEDFDLWLRLLWAGHQPANLAESLLHRRRHTGSVSAKNVQEQSENFRALVRNNIRFLLPIRTLSPYQIDLLWSLQVGGGANAALDDIQAAIQDIQQLLLGVAEYYCLSVKERTHVQRLANIRTASTLLHMASLRSYDLRLIEARVLASWAIRLNPALLLTKRYWRMAFKIAVGLRCVTLIDTFRSRESEDM